MSERIGYFLDKATRTITARTPDGNVFPLVRVERVQLQGKLRGKYGMTSEQVDRLAQNWVDGLNAAAFANSLPKKGAK